jgi:hypothetical protein
VKGYFYNPNIHPYTEFVKRKETLVSLSRVEILPLMLDEGYELDLFLKAALERGKDRCLSCYRIRLTRTFEKAAEEEAEAVTTTLLYSKYQRHEAIAAIAEELAKEYNIPFLYRDFRIGWKKGQDDSRRMGLYRQNYCGCIFSEYERFASRAKREG